MASSSATTVSALRRPRISLSVSLTNSASDELMETINRIHRSGGNGLSEATTVTSTMQTVVPDQANVALLIATDLQSRRQLEYVDAIVYLDVGFLRHATARRMDYERRMENFGATCTDMDKTRWETFLFRKRRVEKSKADQKLVREAYTCLRRKWDEEDAAEAEAAANVENEAERRAEMQTDTGIANSARESGKQDGSEEESQEILSARLEGTHIDGV